MRSAATTSKGNKWGLITALMRGIKYENKKSTKIIALKPLSNYLEEFLTGYRKKHARICRGRKDIAGPHAPFWIAS